MSPKQRFPVMLEPFQLLVLREIEKRTGAPVAEQIRRAIDVYIEQQAIVLKGELKRLRES